MKEIPSLKSRRQFINFGKYVKCLSWCPKLSTENQVLVGITTDDKPNAEYHYEATINENNTDLIQIWECGNLWELRDEPKLSYCIANDWGHIVCASWISPDEVNMNVVNRSPFIRQKRQPLHGHMMFCCTDGFIRIIGIPKFSEEDLVKLLGKVYEEGQGINHHCWQFPIIKYRKSSVMKLGLATSFIVGQHHLFGYPTCAHWRNKFPSKIVVGFSKGYVAVYDLSVYHPLRYDSVNHYLKPIYKRRVSFVSIRQVIFSPFEWKTINITVSANSYPQTNFVMRISSRVAPTDIIQLDQPPHKMIWCYHSDVCVCVPINCDSVQIHSIMCQSVINVPLTKIKCLSYCEPLNSLLIATQSGSVMSLSLNNRTIMQSIYKLKHKTDLHDLYKNVKHYRFINKTTFRRPDEEQILVICDIQTDVAQLYDDVSDVSYPNITELAINPNITTAGFVAIAFANGLVHLINFADAELSEIMRDISLFSIQNCSRNPANDSSNTNNTSSTNITMETNAGDDSTIEFPHFETTTKTYIRRRKLNGQKMFENRIYRISKDYKRKPKKRKDLQEMEQQHSKRLTKSNKDLLNNRMSDSTVASLELNDSRFQHNNSGNIGDIDMENDDDDDDDDDMEIVREVPSHYCSRGQTNLNLNNSDNITLNISSDSSCHSNQHVADDGYVATNEYMEEHAIYPFRHLDKGSNPSLHLPNQHNVSESPSTNSNTANSRQSNNPSIIHLQRPYHINRHLQSTSSNNQPNSQSSACNSNRRLSPIQVIPLDQFKPGNTKIIRINPVNVRLISSSQSNKNN